MTCRVLPGRQHPHSCALVFLAAVFHACVCFAADPDPYGYVRHVAYAPNGESVAIATAHGVEIWDTTLSKLLQTYPIASSPTRMRLVWSPDSRSIVLNTQEKIYLWEGGVGTAPKEAMLAAPSPFPPAMPWLASNPPPSVAWSPPGDRLALLQCFAQDGIAIIERDSFLWGLPAAVAGHLIPPMPRKIQGARLFEIAWSPDGRRLAGITMQTVELWDAQSGAKIRVINLPTYPAIPGRRQERWPLLAWAPEGNRLASCDRKNHVEIWDADTGDSLQRLDGGNSSHTRLSWSRKGDRLALATEESVTVWNATTGAAINRTRNALVASYVSFSPDLDRGVIANGEGRLELWPPLSVQSSGAMPRYVAWAPRDQLAVWDSAGTVKVFDGASQSVALTAQAAVWGRQSVAVSPSGDLALPAGDGTITVYSEVATMMAGRQQPPPIRPRGYVTRQKLIGAKPPIYAIAFSERAVAALAAGSLWIWDWARPDLQPLHFGISGVELVWTSSNTLLIAGFDGSVAEFDLTTQKPVWSCPPQNPARPEPARLSPDGRFFFANQTIWRRNKEGTPATAIGTSYTPYWTADGRAFITTPELGVPSGLSRPAISAAAPWTSLGMPPVLQATTSDLAWNADGTSLALATLDGSVHIQRLRLQPKE